MFTELLPCATQYPSVSYGFQLNNSLIFNELNLSNNARFQKNQIQSGHFPEA
jgi:hypothetical protein